MSVKINGIFSNPLSQLYVFSPFHCGMEALMIGFRFALEVAYLVGPLSFTQIRRIDLYQFTFDLPRMNDIEKNEKSQIQVDFSSSSTSSDRELASDFDVGYGYFLKGEENRAKVDNAEEEELVNKRILKKIDMRILPIISVVYCLQSMDKQGISYSNVFGFQQDLHLVGQQFSWISSIFYFGYLVAQYPLAWLMQRMPLGKFLGVIIFLWAITMMSTAGCTNFTGAMINRIVLGCIEAVVTPSFVLITGMWYTSAEQPFRQLIWFSFQAWGSSIGALIAYGVGHIQGGIQQWKYIFLVLGGTTALFSFVVFFFLPDSPVSARFLTEEQKVIAVRRVASNKTGIENKRFKSYQVYQALRDPKLYLLFIHTFGSLISGGLLTSFRSQIIKNMGFDVLQSTILGIPSDFIQGFCLVLCGYIASVVPNSRIIVMTISNVVCVVAAALMTYLPIDNNWGRLVSYWFTTLQSIGFSLGLSMVSVNMGGYTKRAFTGATMFIAYCIGNIIGPFFVFPSQAPRYLSALEAMLYGYIIKTVAGIVLGLYMLWENKQRDRLQASQGPPFDERDGQRLSLLDKTEFDNPHFRYSL